MVYYIKGGSKYNELNPKVWVNLFLGGFDESFYIDPTWKNIADKGVETDGDPYWRLGGVPGGEERAEFGLRNKSRIMCGDDGGTESVWGWDIIAGDWVDLIAGGGVAHNRLHAITSVQDHNANQWKVWYSDGTLPNAEVKELALGVAGTIFTSNGVAVAPSFQVGGYAFKTITGITNDVVADEVADTLELVAGAGLTIVGDAVNDKITFTNTITQYTNDMVDALIVASGHLSDPILLTEMAEQDAPAANKMVIWAEKEHGHTVLRHRESDGHMITIGQDMYIIGRNTSGTEIAKGKIVYFNGTSTGKHPNFSMAKADSLTTMPAIGITMSIVANSGYTTLMIRGRLTGLNTPWANGTQLYVSATVAGGYTNTFPPSPSIDQQVGIVEINHAVTGVLLVNFRQMQGRNDGTIRQSFSIGDGVSGDVTLTFNGDVGDDGSIVYDVSEDEFVLDRVLNMGTKAITNVGNVDGKDVSGLCTEEEAHAYIEATALTMTQDITFKATQLFDGEDVSALATDLSLQCTTAEAIQAVEDTGLTMGAHIIVMGADTHFGDFDLEKVGTVYHDETITQWLVQLSSTGYDGGSLYNAGLYYNTGTDILTLTGRTGLHLGMQSDIDIIDILSTGVRIGGANARITTILDEDNMATDSATALATQQSIKKYVDDNIYSEAEVDARIIVQNTHPAGTIDIAIDALILTHKGLPNDHHVAFVQGDADALYSVLAHIHDGRYYTKTEINANTYTRAQVDALEWVEADITDLDKYTVAQVNALIDRFDEQSAIFPGAPSEGNFHYDEDDDSFYRYNTEALAWIEVGVMGAIASEVDNLGNHVATEPITGITRLQGAGSITIAPLNDLDDELVIDSIEGNLRIYQEGATEASEAGIIGHAVGATKRPLQSLYANAVYDDDGAIGEYSTVDDLQLLRDLKTYDREKAMSPDFPKIKQKVWDVNTLPWVVAHPEVNKLETTNNNKRYSITTAGRTGYLLSTLKKLLEEIDTMKLRIKDLEEK